MHKIGISGGPHSGKSTLFEAIKIDEPDMHYIPEAATKIISRELEKEERTPGYTPLVPWLNNRLFNLAVMSEYMDMEMEIDDLPGISIQDRTLWDTVHYSKEETSRDLIPEVERRARAANYAFILFCEPVGTYTQTDIRVEPEQEALEIHESLRGVYENSGLQIVSLPDVGVMNRLSIVTNAIWEYTLKGRLAA